MVKQRVDHIALTPKAVKLLVGHTEDDSRLAVAFAGCFTLGVSLYMAVKVLATADIEATWLKADPRLPLVLLAHFASYFVAVLASKRKLRGDVILSAMWTVSLGLHRYP